MPASEFLEKLKGMFPRYLGNEEVSIDNFYNGICLWVTDIENIFFRFYNISESFLSLLTSVGHQQIFVWTNITRHQAHDCRRVFLC